MKITILVTLLRIIATVWLVNNIYTESGIYTAFAIALIGISVELQSIAIKAQLFSVTLIKERLFNHTNKQG